MVNRWREWIMGTGSKREVALDDPLFGHLLFDGCFWSGLLRLPSGSEVQIRIDPGLRVDRDAPLTPTERQREALLAFLAEEEAIYRKAELALFDYYYPVQARLRRPGLPNCEPAPPLMSPNDVWRIVKDFGLFIPRNRVTPRIILEWLSPSDPDGVQIVLKSNEIESIGPLNDIVFEEDAD
jgi:hypothetical protein